MAKNMMKDFDYAGYADMLESANELEVHIVHTFDEYNTFGGFTVAWQRANAHKHGKMVNVAVTFCSDKDQFCKKIGTYNTLSKFFNENAIQVPIGSEDSELIVQRLRMMFTIV